MQQPVINQPHGLSGFFKPQTLTSAATTNLRNLIKKRENSHIELISRASCLSIFGLMTSTNIGSGHVLDILSLEGFWLRGDLDWTEEASQARWINATWTGSLRIRSSLVPEHGSQSSCEFSMFLIAISEVSVWDDHPTRAPGDSAAFIYIT